MNEFDIRLKESKECPKCGCKTALFIGDICHWCYSELEECDFCGHKSDHLITVDQERMCDECVSAVQQPPCPTVNCESCGDWVGEENLTLVGLLYVCDNCKAEIPDDAEEDRIPSSYRTSEYKCANCSNERCGGMICTDPDADDYEDSGYCPVGFHFMRGDD
jgi:hypothetical protein